MNPFPSVSPAAPRQSLAGLLLLALLFLLLGALVSFGNLLLFQLAQLYSLPSGELLAGPRASLAASLLLALPAGWLVARLGSGRSLAGGLLALAAGLLLLAAAANGWGSGLVTGGLVLLGASGTLLQVAALAALAGSGPAHRAALGLSLLGGAQALGTSLLPLLGSVTVQRPGPYLALGAGLLAGAALALLGWWRAAKRPAAAFVPAATPVPAVAPAPVADRPASGWEFRQLQLGLPAALACAGVPAGLGVLFIPYGQSLGLPQLSAFTVARLHELDAGLRWLLGATGPAAGQPVAAAGSFTVAVGATLLGLYWLGLAAGRLVGLPLLALVPGRLVLAASAAAGAALVGAALLLGGDAALWLLVASGLATALLWPLVAARALAGLGRGMPLGAGLLVLASLAGTAVVPPLLGWLAAHGGWGAALGLPVAGYCYLVYYALRGGRWPVAGAAADWPAR